MSLTLIEMMVLSSFVCIHVFLVLGIMMLRRADAKIAEVEDLISQCCKLESEKPNRN